MLTALTSAHLARVTHRRLTPHNVILGADGPRVTDAPPARRPFPVGLVAAMAAVMTICWAPASHVTGGDNPPNPCRHWHQMSGVCTFILGVEEHGPLVGGTSVPQVVTPRTTCARAHGTPRA